MLKRYLNQSLFLVSYLFLYQLNSCFSLYSQNTLPILEHHNLYEGPQNLTFVWVNQNPLYGSWLMEHSFNGLEWNTIQTYKNSQNLYFHRLPKNLYGFIRLRWVNQNDTTTITVHNLNDTQKKGLFACYDEENCKISLGYQIPFQTDLLLRFYNSIGEEITTSFLYHQPNQLNFWNFEPTCLKKDIYLLRLVDALTKEILLDFRLPILYDSLEKKSN